jgi:hypothetical protein
MRMLKQHRRQRLPTLAQVPGFEEITGLPGVAPPRNRANRVDPHGLPKWRRFGPQVAQENIPAPCLDCEECRVECQREE